VLLNISHRNFRDKGNILFYMKHLLITVIKFKHVILPHTVWMQNSKHITCIYNMLLLQRSVLKF